MMAPPIVAEVLSSKGDALDSRVTATMGSRLRHDFSDVRVHTDAAAAESARSVEAAAYTVGRDIVFAAGQYEPASSTGQKLIAHELVHVLQQGSAGVPGGSDLEVTEPNGEPEREADLAAAALEAGTSGPTTSKLAVRRLRLQRQIETHAGVFQQTRHAPIGGPGFSPVAQYDVRLEFTPYEVDDCDQIAMTQTALQRVGGALVFPSAAQRTRALTAAEGTEGVAIDRLSGRSTPLYGVSNVGVAAATTHFGKKRPKHPPETAWMEDLPGADGSTPGSSRAAGGTESEDFETCAICNAGTDAGAYYGCVSWGYEIDAANTFTEHVLTQVSRGTPSATFLAAAKKWNAQTVPVATTDLPVPAHVTRSTNLTWADLEAEIKSLDTKLKGLPVGDVDRPQVTFELRVYRDIRDAIVFNRAQGYSIAEIKAVQATVKAAVDGVWGFETVVNVKEWQALNALTADGRVGPATAKKLGIRP
jgi:hypothetical protein